MRDITFITKYIPSIKAVLQMIILPLLLGGIVEPQIVHFLDIVPIFL